MPYFIAWCGFVGAWLLVAGPAYQAVLDFQEEDFDSAQFDVARQTITVQPVSRWWLLLPPVWFARKQRQNREYQRFVMDTMPKEQQEGFIRISNIASAWMFVAGGALLIAVKETWEVIELYEWSIAAFVALLLGALAVCLAYLVSRTRFTKRALDKLTGSPSASPADAPQR